MQESAILGSSVLSAGSLAAVVVGSVITAVVSQLECHTSGEVMAQAAISDNPIKSWHRLLSRKTPRDSLEDLLRTLKPRCNHGSLLQRSMPCPWTQRDPSVDHPD